MMPWTRWVDEEVTANKRNLSVFRQDIVNANKALTASVNVLAEQQRLGASNLYTKAEVDDKDTVVFNASARTIHTHTVADITGTWDKSVNTTGAINTTGTVKADAGMNSIDTRNRVLTTSYAGMWVDGAGNYGISPSSIKYKKDVGDWANQPEKLLGLRAVTYRYKGQPDDEALKLGFIAEEVMEAGLPEFVFYDADGVIQGINYDKMVVALVELVKKQEARITQLESVVE